jgi:hypothetical protein
MDYAYMSYGQLLNNRNVTGTQIFQYQFGVISASAQFVLDIAEDKPVWKKYLPFNSVTFKNNAGVDFNIYINQNQDIAINVPSGTIITYSSGVGIWSLTVVNLSSTTASTINKFIAEFERTGMDSNQLSKTIANSFIGKLIGAS